MFIPLTINNALRGESWPNVLIAGDTAGIFYLLSMASSLEANIFLADTGIKKPLREFPCHRGDTKDRANVYYDFFDGRIGAGIVRRMDAILCASYDLKRWSRLFQVPSACIWHDASGSWAEFEGATPALPCQGEGSAMTGLIAGFVRACRGVYGYSTVRVLVNKQGEVQAFPATGELARYPEADPCRVDLQRMGRRERSFRGRAVALPGKRHHRAAHGGAKAHRAGHTGTRCIIDRQLRRNEVHRADRRPCEGV